jgi:tyrosine-protein phosphatase YwqE
MSEPKKHSIQVKGTDIYIDGELVDPSAAKIILCFKTPLYLIEFDLKESPLSFEGIFTADKEATGELN